MTNAVLQSSGTSPDWRDLLNKMDRGTDTPTILSFRNLVDILSGPEEELIFKLLILLATVWGENCMLEMELLPDMGGQCGMLDLSSVEKTALNVSFNSDAICSLSLTKLSPTFRGPILSRDLVFDFIYALKGRLLPFS